ncbi:adenylosuccinate synthase [Granulicella sp. 5B5]|uniref:adenylosuccinate synthase n=1 Tax=Granulicella sp. 5B5 TaxID=1617967 RepID=UPI0015F47368|nr:adenylosuccinate synthase [Granulicella sp. 5B5]QMV19343.1 adenylosuccinate synthase [Granulicella sp. 5B5]
MSQSSSVSAKAKRPSAVILGAQWGDEGKGKIVDVLSEKFDIVARYAGGHNAGHTVIIHGKKIVLQLIPCGVLRPECKGVIGNGVVFDPQAFLNEVKKLKEAGLPAYDPAAKQLFVSNRAQVILPYHRMIELAAETAPGRQTIGTTRRGIGPAYEDKIHRNGLRVVDLLNTSLLRTHINNACHEKNTIAHALFGTEPLDPKQMYEEYARLADQIAPFVADTAVLLNDAIRDGKNVMFEGAQGALLDIDHGTYPFVTSSSSTAGGAVTGTGVGPTKIGTVIGVTKAYVTRVGEGPFPTQDDGVMGELLARRGNEFGAVTGRPRRCGWLDLPLLRYSNMINSTEWLVVTKMDVMDECPEIPVCTGYKIDGKVTDVIPADIVGFKKIEPVYTTMKGWMAPTEGITEYDKLPKLAQEYLEFVERESGAKIGMISTGPDRVQTMTQLAFAEMLG